MEDKATQHAGGLHDAPVSKLASWPCAQALQDRLPSAHMLRYAQQLEHCEMPQGTLLLALGWHLWLSDQVAQSWHVDLHTPGSQGLEDRARHPLSRSVPSSLCLLLLWHQHLPRCAGVTGNPLCSLTPSVSSALLLTDRAELKRGAESQDHQSSGSSTWHSQLAKGKWAA